MEALGTIAGAIELAELVRRGFSTVSKRQPEYARFRKEFHRRADREARDLPIETIEGFRLPPEFIGEACRLIRARASGSAAEQQLSLLLQRDPEVAEWTPQPSLEVGSGARRYRPDFVVKAIEFESWVNSAADRLGQSWRFALVTPEDLSQSASWSDVLRCSERRMGDA